MAKRGRIAGVAGLGALVVAVVLLVGRDGEPPPPPEATIRVTEDGVPRAVLDVAALTEWCRDRGLPDPPELTEAEPAVERSLRDALREAAATGTAAAYGRVGQICESLDAHRAAAGYFELALAADSTAFAWVYSLGCVHQATGNSAEARRRFEQALALDPTYATTWARLGHLLLESDEPDRADEMFVRYVALRPGDWLGAVGRGRVALARGDVPGALAYLREAEKIEPDDFQVQYYLGSCLARLGDRTAASSHFDRAEELPQGGWFRMRDPLVLEMHRVSNSVAGLEVEFERHRDSGDWPRLVELAEEIVRRRSSDVTMLGNLAGLYRQVGRYGDAHAALDRAFRAGRDDLRLELLRAEIHLAEGNPLEAVAAGDRAITLDEESSRAHGLRSRGLYLAERYPEAEEAARSALALDPTDPSPRFLLAESLLLQGRVSEAEKEFRSVLELAPGHGPARGRLEEIARVER